MVLETIHSRDDLLRLTPEEQRTLCAEIRQFLVEHVSRTGGHLASNLGIVETTVAIETVFDTRRDRLVFDVGHQSYVHKILTGRRERFDTLRQFGGLCGFMKPEESITDPCVTGHAPRASIRPAARQTPAHSKEKRIYCIIFIFLLIFVE